MNNLKCLKLDNNIDGSIVEWPNNSNCPINMDKTKSGYLLPMECVTENNSSKGTCQGREGTSFNEYLTKYATQAEEYIKQHEVEAIARDIKNDYFGQTFQNDVELSKKGIEFKSFPPNMGCGTDSDFISSLYKFNISYLTMTIQDVSGDYGQPPKPIKNFFINMPPMCDISYWSQETGTNWKDWMSFSDEHKEQIYKNDTVDNVDIKLEKVCENLILEHKGG